MKRAQSILFFLIAFFSLPQLSLAQTVYITMPNNIVYLCNVSSAGPIQNCTPTGNNFNNPVRVSFNPLNTFAYVTNAAAPPVIPLPPDPPPAGFVSYCSINPNKTLSNCQNTGGIFSGPVTAQFNSTGTIAYIASHYPQYKITRCGANSDGTFSNCTDMQISQTFGNANDMVLNFTNNMAYLASGVDWSIYSCPVNADNTFGTCTILSNYQLFQNPCSIILTDNNTNAYIVSSLSATIASCAIDSQGLLGGCKSVNNNNKFQYPSSITLNSENNFLYIAHLWGISYCTINSDKSLGTCKDAVPGGTINFANSKLTFNS